MLLLISRQNFFYMILIRQKLFTFKLRSWIFALTDFWQFWRIKFFCHFWLRILKTFSYFRLKCQIPRLTNNILRTSIPKIPCRKSSKISRHTTTFLHHLKIDQNVSPSSFYSSIIPGPLIILQAFLNSIHLLCSHFLLKRSLFCYSAQPVIKKYRIDFLRTIKFTLSITSLAWFTSVTRNCLVMEWKAG